MNWINEKKLNITSETCVWMLELFHIAVLKVIYLKAQTYIEKKKK